MEKLRSVLVTDRTQADVNARNEKGTYNAEDLNRVLRACSWLAGKMEGHGYSVEGEYFPAVLIYATASPPSGGTVKSALCYVGETAVVEAVPAEQFEFAYWTEAGEVVSNDLVYRFPAERDRDLTAVFRAPEDARLGIVGIGRVGTAQVTKGA